MEPEAVKSPLQWRNWKAALREHFRLCTTQFDTNAHNKRITQYPDYYFFLCKTFAHVTSLSRYHCLHLSLWGSVCSLVFLYHIGMSPRSGYLPPCHVPSKCLKKVKSYRIACEQQSLRREHLVSLVGERTVENPSGNSNLSPSLMKGSHLYLIRKSETAPPSSSDPARPLRNRTALQCTVTTLTLYFMNSKSRRFLRCNTR